MKSYEESKKSYKCVGCGSVIYNATHNYGGACPECGYRLEKIEGVVEEDNEC